jgi:hypothetical protein
MAHEVVWTQPPALLNGQVSTVIPPAERVFTRPAILRFTSDMFMEDFLALLETEPERLRDYLVRRETWRGFFPDALVKKPSTPSAILQRAGIFRRAATTAIRSAAAPVPPASAPLKLYQPAHGRHYLIACSLVCGTVGWPDRAVQPGRGETTAWVLRRLLPPVGDPDAELAHWQEHAWVTTAQGPVWQSVGSDPLRVLPDEERLPLVALSYAERNRKRRLFSAVIPVGKREAYLAAPSSAGGSGGVTPRTSRKILFRRDVAEPWKALIARAARVGQSIANPRPGDDPPNTQQKAELLKTERSQIQALSWLILLDFAKYLRDYLRPVWRAVLDPSMAGQLTRAERDAFDALSLFTVTATLRGILARDSEVAATGNRLYQDADVLATLREALALFGTAPEALNDSLEAALDRVEVSYERGDANSRSLWPGFLFPLADPDATVIGVLTPFLPLAGTTPEEDADLLLDENPTPGDPAEKIDRFAVLLLRALRDDEPDPAPQPAVPAAAIAPANAVEGWFAIRCVHERPACAPLRDDVVSSATEPFQMAGFFDPDAPARPVRIGLPIDTTPAGLRKFDRNTAFVISDTLCGQIRRFKGLTLGDLVRSVLPWPLHKDLPSGSASPCQTSGGLSLGMICSFSIPIITLCALILLMVMVSLLDIIFRWTPFFVMCFPVPGLKAKR